MEFAGSTKNPEKIIEIPNLLIKTKILAKKKVKRSQKIVWELLDGICRLNPKS
jgi:hypothetical protein